MGRKHQRDDHVEALDTAALEAEANAAADRANRVVRRRETEAERDERIRKSFARKRIRSDARTDERVADCLRGRWSTCCIPGCSTQVIGRRLRPDRTVMDGDAAEALPVCERHQVMIRNMVEPRWTSPDLVAMRERFARQVVEKEVERQKRFDLYDESAGAKQGQIYFVRLNGMVKVGWSSKLRSRLKSYGASAEILAHYPASRAEEKDLHRQLRPYLAMGREWYQDCQLIADVVAGVVKRHGEPSVLPYWTEPKKDLSARPRGYPAA